MVLELRFEPVPDFFVDVPVLLLLPDLLVAACELVVVLDVVVAVSFVFVHDVANATATAALRLRRRDFFIGVLFF